MLYSKAMHRIQLTFTLISTCKASYFHRLHLAPCCMSTGNVKQQANTYASLVAAAIPITDRTNAETITMFILNLPLIVSINLYTKP